MNDNKKQNYDIIHTKQQNIKLHQSKGPTRV